MRRAEDVAFAIIERLPWPLALAVAAVVLTTYDVLATIFGEDT